MLVWPKTVVNMWPMLDARCWIFINTHRVQSKSIQYPETSIKDQPMIAIVFVVSEWVHVKILYNYRVNINNIDVIPYSNHLPGAKMEKYSCLRINSPNIVHETIDGETIILNMDNGNYYSLIETGVDIWGFIEKGVAEDINRLYSLIDKAIYREKHNG